MPDLLTRTWTCFGLLFAAAPLWAATLELSAVNMDQAALPDVVFQVRSTQGLTPAERQPSASIDQRDKQFVPHVLAIDSGTSVTFPNSDNIRHHVYSFSEPKQFELPLYHGEPAAPVVFDQPGIVVLGCNIHDNMLAYVVVTPDGWHAVSDDSGKASIELPAGEYEISFWHPRATTQPLPRSVKVPSDGESVSVRFGVLKPDPRMSSATTSDNPFKRRAFNAP